MVEDKAGIADDEDMLLVEVLYKSNVADDDDDEYMDGVVVTR